MSDKQMNLLTKKADMEPKIKVPASIEEKARKELEPEEQKNVVVVDNYKTESSGENPTADTNKTVDGESGEYSQQSDMADYVRFTAICPMCKQDKELQWVNPGGLGPNTEISEDCIPKLFEGYGYKEPRYRIIDENTVEIFSETTGWQKIKTH